MENAGKVHKAVVCQEKQTLDYKFVKAVVDCRPKKSIFIVWSVHSFLLILIRVILVTLEVIFRNLRSENESEKDINLGLS